MWYFYEISEKILPCSQIIIIISQYLYFFSVWHDMKMSIWHSLTSHRGEWEPRRLVHFWHQEWVLFRHFFSDRVVDTLPGSISPLPILRRACIRLLGNFISLSPYYRNISFYGSEQVTSYRTFPEISRRIHEKISILFESKILRKNNDRFLKYKSHIFL